MPLFDKLLKPVGRHIRTTLIAGLLIIIPVVVTFILLRFVFDFLDAQLQQLLDPFIPFYPGMGIIALVILIYLAGFVTTHVLSRRMINLGYSLIDRVPVVNSVYRAARQATEVISNVGSNGKFSSVVFVDFPGYGLKSIGLVTATLKDQDGKPLLAVYMPTSPFPTSGFLLIIPEDRVTPTDLPVDEAMKLIVSAGIIAPDKITSGPDVFANFRPPPEILFTSEELAGKPYDPDNRASNQ